MNYSFQGRSEHADKYIKNARKKHLRNITFDYKNLKNDLVVNISRESGEELNTCMIDVNRFKNSKNDSVSRRIK